MKNDSVFWLTRRLNEIRKTKLELAAVLGINSTRFSELEKGMWKFQVSHLKKVAEFLEFDRTAFLDFISGDITEEELWNYQKPEEISAEDMALLKAVKSLASRQETPQDVKNPSKPATIPPKIQERV
jgi:transcriptional regulator with XRE-family HTH domain